MIRSYPVFGGNVVQGDVGSSYDIIVTGLPVNPTSVTISFELVRAQSFVQVLDAEAVALNVVASGGEWSCTLRHVWAETETDVPGLYRARFVLSETGLSLSIPATVSAVLRIVPRSVVGSGSG